MRALLLQEPFDVDWQEFFGHYCSRRNFGGRGGLWDKIPVLLTYAQGPLQPFPVWQYRPWGASCAPLGQDLEQNYWKSVRSGSVCRAVQVQLWRTGGLECISNFLIALEVFPGQVEMKTQFPGSLSWAAILLMPEFCCCGWVPSSHKQL